MAFLPWSHISTLQIFNTLPPGWWWQPTMLVIPMKRLFCLYTSTPNFNRHNCRSYFLSPIKILMILFFRFKCLVSYCTYANFYFVPTHIPKPKSNLELNIQKHGFKFETILMYIRTIISSFEVPDTSSYRRCWGWYCQYAMLDLDSWCWWFWY